MAKKIKLTKKQLASIAAEQEATTIAANDPNNIVPPPPAEPAEPAEPATPPETPEDINKTYTKEELDKIIADRLAAEKEKLLEEIAAENNKELSNNEKLANILKKQLGDKYNTKYDTLPITEKISRMESDLELISKIPEVVGASTPPGVPQIPKVKPKRKSIMEQQREVGYMTNLKNATTHLKQASSKWGAKEQ